MRVGIVHKELMMKGAEDAGQNHREKAGKKQASSKEA
jgi:hypothetical protein